MSGETKDYISFKSINLMSDREGVVPKSIAIVPFPPYNLKGFIRSIVTKDKTRRGGLIDSSITVLFDDSSITFYQYIDTIEHIFDETVNKINELIETKAERQQIEEELINFYNNLTKAFENAYIEKMPKTVGKTSLFLLFSLFPKKLDRIFNELILGNPIIVTGDKTLVRLIIDTLTIFSIKENPEKIYWTEEYTAGDIIGGPIELKDIFKMNLLLDLKKGKIIGGKSNRYCKKIINLSRQLDSELAEQKIKEKIQEFQSRANEILDMAIGDKISSKKIDIFIKNVDIDELELIEAFLIEKNSNISKEITDVISMCRKKMDKIISGFEKEKW